MTFQLIETLRNLDKTVVSAAIACYNTTENFTVLFVTSKCYTQSWNLGLQMR